MNLTGGPTTLKLNIAALVLALIINSEAAYIAHRVTGRLVWADCLLGFVPVLVMFIIRDRIYSYAFLFLHLVIAVDLFFRARSVGLSPFPPAKLYPQVTFLLIASLVGVAVYGAWRLIAYAGALIRKSRAPRDG